MISLGHLIQRFGGTGAGFSGLGPDVRDVQVDSRLVEDGDLFAALPGTQADGASYVRQALERGAHAILSPQHIRNSELAHQGSAAPTGQGKTQANGEGGDPPQWIHPQARRVTGLAAALIHGEPARNLFTAGITGTNGKTTTAFLAGQLLAGLGRVPAVLGTVGYQLADGFVESTHTTPDAPQLQRLLARHLRAGGDCAVLEVSSHALVQERVSGIDFDAAVFTGLSHDHLDYHGSIENYVSAKARLFQYLGKNATAIIHADSKYAPGMCEAARNSGASVLKYSVGSRADLCATPLYSDRGGTVTTVKGMGVPLSELRIPLIGNHNVENALAALAVALTAGGEPLQLLDGLERLQPAPGRLAQVDTGRHGFTVLIDYAHSPAALAEVLAGLGRSLLGRGEGRALDAGPLTPSGAGRLLVAFGCGGDRDTEKRAPMGRLAAQLADVVVLTNDNPRGEDPASILDQVELGAREGSAEVHREQDRRSAIRLILSMARVGDVVLIAGKGHETYQLIGDERRPFDDRAEVLEALA